MRRPQGDSLGTVLVAGVAVAAITIPRSLSYSSRPWFLLAIAAVVTLTLVAGIRQVGRISPPWPSLAFVGWCGLSVVWSSYPHRSLESTALTLLITALAVVVAARTTPRGTVVAGAIAATLVTAGSAAYYASGGRLRTRTGEGGIELYQGIFGNWNILGYTLVLLLPAVLSVRPRTRAGHAARAVLLVAMLASLAASRSATSIIVAGLVIAVAVCLWSIDRTQSRVTPATGRRAWSRVIVIGSSATAAIVSAGAMTITLLGKDVTTLSGRVPLWNAIGAVGSEQPWGGYGWGAVWQYYWYRTTRSEVGDAINDQIMWPLSHGHSILFDTAIQVGAVGAALLVVALSVALWRSARSVVSDVDETSTWTFLTLVAIVVLGVTEPITATPVGWFLLTLVLCRAPRRDPEDAPRHPRRPRAQPATSSPPRPAPNDSPEGAR